MIINSETPTYNLRAVVRETGLKADTLRAWERRYGLPVPKRSEGGHRVYSRRDIETLKWLVSRVAEGLSISRAVELWRKLEEAGEDPIEDLLSVFVRQAQPIVDSGSTLDEIKLAWITACLDFDEPSADAVITQAFAIFPIETVTHQILLPAISEIGEKWYSGEITVQQEHFTSQLTLKRLGALLVATPSPTRSENIIIACPPDEEHTISLVLLTLALKRSGYPVYYFGANTPVDQLEEAISAIKPDLLISSAQQLSTTDPLLRLATVLFENKIPFAYGGRIFNLMPVLQNKIPGHFLGETLEGTYGQIESIVSNSLLPDFPQDPSSDYGEVGKALQDLQSEVSTKVIERITTAELPEEVTQLFLNHLTDSILSSISMGDLNLGNYDLEWLKGLLDNRSINSSTMDKILREFAHSVEESMGTQAKFISDWIQDFLTNNSSRSTL